MKTWKKGAIVGAVWGIIGTPIYILIGLAWWERSFPRSIETILLFLIHFPAKILSNILIKYYGTSYYSILFFGSNFLGWIIIGVIAGYLYGGRGDGDFK